MYGCHMTWLLCLVVESRGVDRRACSAVEPRLWGRSEPVGHVLSWRVHTLVMHTLRQLSQRLQSQRIASDTGADTPYQYRIRVDSG